MGLVIDRKGGLYNGVNQQSAEHRLETQVESMVNVTPTVNSGLLKRNPTTILKTDYQLDYDDEMFTYDYDRGLSGDSEEKYSIQITKAGMQIINVITGQVYTKANGGLIYEDVDDEQYILNFVNANGYACVTIKDTTFIVNKNIPPKLDDFVFGKEEGGEATTVDTHSYHSIMVSSPIKTGKDTGGVYDQFPPIEQKNFRPATFYVDRTDGSYDYIYATSSSTIITVDGETITMMYPKEHVASYRLTATGSFINDTLNTSFTGTAVTYNEYLKNMETLIRAKLDNSRYNVSTKVNSNNTTEIVIKRLDDTSPVVTFDLQIGTPDGKIILDSDTSDYYVGYSTSSTTETIISQPSIYKKTTFYWIKGNNPTSAYNYSFHIKLADGYISSSTVTSTTTDGAAQDIVDYITNNDSGHLTAERVGSIIKITSDVEDIVDSSISDSYGNQATFGWTTEVQRMQELPKNMPFRTLVKVIDVDNSLSKGYWLEWNGTQWKEALGMDVQPNIDVSTMPHILTREANGTTFKLSKYDGWKNQLVGDRETNKTPSFLSGEDNIKDMFFFKNRLGIITDRTVAMSEVGEYGNFWRTTVVAVLDSDPIDTSVDTTKSIQLEFAVYLDDSVMLFSDKAQFKLEGGRILSPTSVQISQTSSYEINKNVRPIFVNDMVFFCAKRGDYTAVMQYAVADNGLISEASDITAQVDKYIPSDAKSLSASPINNMLFITSKSIKNKIWVYKYLDVGNNRVQSAWFQWEYNGDIYGAFSLGRNLNIMINRNSTLDDSSANNFEIQPIHQISHNGYFVDASEFVEDTSVIKSISTNKVGAIAKLSCDYVVYKDTTVEAIGVSSYSISAKTVVHRVGEDDLDITHTSTDSPLVISRNTSETLKSITVTINDDIGTEFLGFEISTVNDSNLLYNSKFDNGLDFWDIGQDFTVNYGTKDIGSPIKSSVGLGEWVYGVNGKKYTMGNMKMKSCKIGSEDGSVFKLKVENIKRSKPRYIDSKYIIDRKPIIYGDSRNIRLFIEDDSSNGFRINSVTLEGNYNSRDRRR